MPRALAMALCLACSGAPLAGAMGGPARAEGAHWDDSNDSRTDASLAVSAPRADASLRTEVIFLKENGMGAERALVLYERVIGQSGESSAMVGRQPNMLVVRDTPERLSRFRALIAALDRGGEGLRLYVRPIAHLAPSELAALLSELAPQGAHLVPDDRSSQLVVSATLTDYRRLDALIRRLDVPAQGRQTREIRVTPAPSEGGFPP